MKNRVMTPLIVLMLIGGLAVAGSGFAGADDLKARMKARLPVILTLKAQGIIGEDSRGYLAFVGSKQANPEVVAAENSDRRTVYDAIARQQGTTADLVGIRRALQIAPKSGSG